MAMRGTGHTRDAGELWTAAAQDAVGEPIEQTVMLQMVRIGGARGGTLSSWSAGRIRGLVRTNSGEGGHAAGMSGLPVLDAT